MGFFSSRRPRTELLTVRNGTNYAIEVIFVHGLDGDPYGTWSFDKDLSWSRWIAARQPNANIRTLRYRLRSSLWFGGAMPLRTRARNILAVLDSELPAETPIVFVCHSYGGLLVKQLLRTGEEMGGQYEPLVSRVAGIVFLATPHTGSSIATFIAAIGPIVRAGSAIKELRRSSDDLQDLNYWFRERAATRKWLLKAYFETLPTYGAIVVDESSADLGLFRPTPVEANHIDICKPEVDDFRVKNTISMIEQVLASKAPPSNHSEGSPLSQVLAASNDALPFYKLKFEALLARNPGDFGLRTALQHLSLIETASDGLSRSPDSRVSRTMRFATFAVLGIGLAAMTAAISSIWSRSTHIEATHGQDRQNIREIAQSNNESKADKDALIAPDLNRSVFAQLTEKPDLKDVMRGQAVTTDNSTGISLPIRKKGQVGPRKDVAAIVTATPPSRVAVVMASKMASAQPVEPSITSLTPASGISSKEADVAKAELLAVPSFRWPARGRVAVRFGAKINGNSNDGINITLPIGTPIKAAEDGVVAYSGNELKGYGSLVLVRHANGYVTAYANASELLVKRGDTVKRGQTIAKSGQSGDASAPQLHFEIRKGSSPVDPLQFLDGW